MMYDRSTPFTRDCARVWIERAPPLRVRAGYSSGPTIMNSDYGVVVQGTVRAPEY